MRCPLPLLGAMLGTLATAVEAQKMTRAPGSPTTLVTHQVAPDARYNVLILLADDLGVDMLAAYGEGADLPPTPTLDLLASQGVLFRNVWSQPTCSPTRATILTGQQGFRTGIGTVVIPFQNVPDLSVDELSLPRMLDLAAEQTYGHAAFGKWHVSSLQSGPYFAPNLSGWDHFAGAMEGQLGNYFLWDKVVDGMVQPVSSYVTTEAVDDASNWIAQQTDPWLCYLAFHTPHAPFHAPPDHLHTQNLGSNPRRNCGDTTGDDPRPYYKAMIESMDMEIGRLLAEIDADVLEETIVIFLGDNGTETCLGVAPFDGPGKSTLYEGGINVPLLVSGPLITRPGECQALVQTTDLFATVAELASVDLEASFPGMEFDSVSLVPYLRRPNRASLRQFVFSELFTPNGSEDFAIPPCPTTPVCQADVGFGGPGNLTLSSCGPPLFGRYGNNHVSLELTGATPFAAATLRIGPLQPGFDPQVGETVVSVVPEAEVAFTTDAAGNLLPIIWTGNTSGAPYYQFVVADATQLNGFAVSNALRMEFLDTRMFAVRDEQFKLIQFDPCYQEVYDLQTDPFEQNDLLQAPLSQEAFVRWVELRRVARARRSFLTYRAPQPDTGPAQPAR